LLVYLLIFWGPNFETIDNNPLLKDNIYGKLVIFAIFTILIGESINAVTSRYTTISPVPTSFKEKMEYLFLRRRTPSIIISKLGESEWPVWLNETHYPVSFDRFDRDFLLRIDTQKKPIAGKLGWIAFYRNFFSVFILVFSLDLFLSALTQYNILAIQIPSASMIHLTLVLSSILSVVFFFGYRAQNEANFTILWNSYRRNELTKSLEAKYGDLPTALGVIDDFKQKSLDYITDRWFLSVESAIKAVSSVIYSQAERAYATFRTDTAQHNSHVDSKSFIIKRIPSKLVDLGKKDATEIDKHIQRHLVRAASAWHDGEYETVINLCLKVIKEIDEQIESNNRTDGHAQTGKATDADFWKFIKGFYLFEDELYTDEAFSEIQSNVARWKWIYPKSNSDSETVSASGKPNAGEDGNSGYLNNKIIHSSRIAINSPVKKEKDLVWESGDPFSRTAIVILEVLRKFESCRNELSLGQQEHGLNFIKCILADFGGFEYRSAMIKANTLLFQLNIKEEERKDEEYYLNLTCNKHSFDQKNTDTASAMIRTLE
jgi:hypothetical protein